MAGPSKQLVVLSDWQDTLRRIMKETETERKAVLKQYDEAIEKCGDQSARDARYETRNQQLKDIRVRIIDAIAVALDKNNAKTVEDQDILNAKEHLAYNFFCSDLFSEAEKIYREVLPARFRTNSAVQLVTLTRHMLLATLRERANAGLTDGDPDVVRREAVGLAVDNINYTTGENKKLDEDVDLALDLLNSLPQHNSSDKTMMATVLRKKIELLGEHLRQGSGANTTDKIQLIIAKWKLFKLLSDGLGKTDQARNVAISLEPDLRDASGNSTLVPLKDRHRLRELLAEVDEFLAATDMTATGTETPTDETPPTGGIRRTDTWRSNPVYDEEDEEAALFDAGGQDRDENPAYSRRWMRSFAAFRYQTLLDAAVGDITRARVCVAIIDTGIDPKNSYINTYRKWEPSYKVGNILHERYRDFSNIQPPPATVKTKDGEAGAPTPDQAQAQVPPQPEDKDGHGTFIAGIFLQLVPDVDLRVARIGVKRSEIQTDKNLSFKIAQAVKHAAETWKSEIISISFSCKKTTDVKEAIEYALSKQILIFAATGNTGYNNDLIYPAAEDKVFKISACDHNGEKARYAAPAADKRYTLLTLGSAVESTWPPSLRAEGADNGLEIKCPEPDARDKPEYLKQHQRDGKCDCNDTWTVMSGTSFAAPIAASFAAVVYQFWNTHQGKFRLNEGTDPFKSIHSMRLVLKAMARKTELSPNDRVYILPPFKQQGSTLFKFLPKPTNKNLNQQDQTYNEFFIDALQRAINQGDGS